MSEKVSQYGICPFATTQKVLTGKWALVIIYQLSTGTKRFNQLQRLIPGITQTILTRHLRQLEADKIVERKVYAEIPPRVEYSLTPIGQSFQTVLDAVEVWGKDYMELLQEPSSKA
ncbi:winged helix-turn-helix transcriptional regulator [Streptococcus cuniculipharyngis]|uniref:Helix-turn-helix transcriptional regulator n=1 Tax=Streptococcus cuniculipharyngis TaxID=1562651 RepID=A0A5C5SDM9_9STRE|nr:helix-turn-helix domain-containing protein [Streptococcus cuniculipharyngis]TWS99207.1 helix-turn-helix transcriptional regulator [Streptococcus cuniculipharyngis]